MIKNLILYLNKNDLIKLILILILTIGSSFFELIGIGSIPIFLGVILNPEKVFLYIPEYFKPFLSNFGSSSELIIFFCFVLFFIFLIKNIYLFSVNFIQASYFRDLRIKNSDKLLKYFFTRPYIYFVNNNPDKLLRSLGSDLDLANNYIEANLNIMKETILVVLICILLVSVSNNTAILVFFSIGLLSYIVLRLFKKKLSSLAKINFIERAEQNKIVYQIFYNIQDIKILLKENFFLNIFKKNIFNLKKTEFFNTIFTKSLRLIFETFAVLSIVLIIIFFSKSDSKIIELLPLLSLLGVSAIRLIPSFNSITLGFTIIRKSEISFDSISKYMKRARELQKIFFQEYSKNNYSSKMIDIELNDLNFKYPERNEYTLKNINLRIKKNTSIGIIGKTGCGKSTLIKLIMGLLKPNSGNILSNKKDIHKDVRSWFNNISYIPQNIFLADDTIKNNIAFGTENNLIDLDRVKYSIKFAGLEKFINDLPNGLDTRVGDGGFKMSGGQVQRIGIARALYKEPNIFILDEATSSLDQKTEDEIINDFFKFNKNKLTIMVSHRLSSLKFCDEVFLIEDGIVKDQGKIDDLILRNESIKK